VGADETSLTELCQTRRPPLLTWALTLATQLVKKMAAKTEGILLPLQ